MYCSGYSAEVKQFVGKAEMNLLISTVFAFLNGDSEDMKHVELISIRNEQIKFSCKHILKLQSLLNANKNRLENDINNA